MSAETIPLLASPATLNTVGSMTAPTKADCRSAWRYCSTEMKLVEAVKQTGRFPDQPDKPAVPLRFMSQNESARQQTCFDEVRGMPLNRQKCGGMLELVIADRKAEI